MITSLSVSNICEEYLKGIKGPKGYMEIFVNPTRKELNDIISTKFDSGTVNPYPAKMVRYSAVSETETLYAWHVDLGFHHQIRHSLRLEGKPVGSWWIRGVFDGVAEKRGGKFVEVGDSDFLVETLYSFPEELVRMLSYDWRWVDNYIDLTESLRDFVEMKMRRRYRDNLPDFPWM
jgi:hypothetical protein